MSKHRSRKTSKSRKIETSNNLSIFFSEVLPFIEHLESEDKILLVQPPQPPRGSNNVASTSDTHPSYSPSGVGGAFGIVIGSDLALSINADYLQRMADYTRQCGSLEAYYDFRARNPKWAAKHNPDQLLLNICRAARLVIAYRYGLALGNAEYLANDDDTLRYDNDNSENPNNRNAEKSSLSSSLSLDESPLFITMMSDESTPQSIGYELAGSITIEEYKPQNNPS